jgi:hypothetical protein
MPDAPRLEEEVLAVFKRALREQRQDAAEHLLCAREALCTKGGAGFPLADAYLSIIGGADPRRPRH